MPLSKDQKETIAPIQSNQRLLSEAQAAEKDGFSMAWHRRKRWEGGGPPYLKIGRTVRYDEAELMAWMNSHRVSNTTEVQQ